MNNATIPTSLYNLCKYYLSTILYDSLCVSFDETKRNTNYIKILKLPINIDYSLKNDRSLEKIYQNFSNSRNKKSLYIGYLTTTDKDNKISPLFLFPITFNNDTFTLNCESPLLNTTAVQNMTSFSNGDSQLINEIIDLQNELDIQNLNFDDVLSKLQEIRPDYNNYKVEIMLFVTETPIYTQGLENELLKLSKLNDTNYKGTALEFLLGTKTITPNTGDNITIHEFLPMNEEQKQAVKKSLINDITVIHGPPGTGKSQVVVNLLINALIKGNKVVFCSKNHKAIDIVKERVNGIMANYSNNTNYKFLLDLTKEVDIADYLLEVVTTNQTSLNNLESLNNDYNELSYKFNNLIALESSLIDLKNVVDSLEKDIVRENFKDKVFYNLKNIDCLSHLNKVNSFKKKIDSCDKNKVYFFSRLFWFFIGKNRFNNLNLKKKDIINIANDIGLFLRDEIISANNFNEFSKEINKVSDLLKEGEKIREYFKCLEKLQKHRSLVDIQKEKMKISKEKNKISKKILECLVIKKVNTYKSDISGFQNFLTLLKIIKNGKAVWQDKREFIKETLEKFDFFAYCITSLSSSHLPFESAIFDIVIFDESSQCDIASALPFLYRSKKVVIIGDKQQLTHITSLPNGIDVSLYKKYKIEPRYSYSINSLFDFFCGVKGGAVVELLNHFRSHFDIVNFSNEFFYGSRLRIETKYETLKKIDNDSVVEWIDIKGKAQYLKNGSVYNIEEIKKIMEILENLILNKKYTGSIGVISPFRTQVNKIEEYKAKSKINDILNDFDININTVHKFQGDEKDIIIFSTAITSDVKIGTLNFLKNTSNLFNVAVTRARAKLIVVGDIDYCKNCGVKYLSKFAEYVDNIYSTTNFHKNVNGKKFESVWEEKLYNKLLDKNIVTIPQYSIDKYRLDLALIINDNKKIDIEIDGETYHKDYNGELCMRDQIRNQRMIELGWEVKRFWVYEIRDDIDGCIDKIRKLL
jgi:superfamily I DNA and/or RNA helicase